MNVILASTSPRRKELLAHAGINFTVVASDFAEDMTLALEPKELALHLARGKAAAVAAKYPDAIIIAADTLGEFNGEVFSKPADEADARRMLKMLSNELHEIHTAFVVRQGTKEVSGVDSVLIQLKDLSDEFIEEHIRTQSMDKAGAYAAQSEPTPIAIYNGEFSTIIGLPVTKVLAALKQFGVKA